MRIEIDFRFMDDELAERYGPPEYGTPGSAAVDLRGCTKRPVVINPGWHACFRTGISIHIKDPGYAAIIIPRSGMGFAHGIGLRNQVGLIDSDYQGEIHVSLINRGDDPYTVQPYDRIAQMLIIPVYQVLWNEARDFERSDRGTAGFGSTGVG